MSENIDMDEIFSHIKQLMTKQEKTEMNQLKVENWMGPAETIGL